jgi:hypothetical protein
MPPQQPNQTNGPRPSFTSQAPHYEYGAAPQQPVQQHPSGQYEVVPPLPVGQNNGHSGHNPYEFIVNPNTPKHSKFSFGGGSSFGLRLAIVGAGLVVLMIIIGVLMSSLGPKSTTPDLEAIAQRQQEIIRIAAGASQQAAGQDTKNFASNVQITVGSSQTEVLNYLAGRGVKMKSKQLALDQNPKIDTYLTDAASANNYDGALAQTLSDELQTYEALLQKTFKETSSKQTRTVLQDCFTTTAGLQAQAKALSSAHP